MNCREARHQILAERDGALNNAQCAALASHVDQCPACRQAREQLQTAITGLRHASAGVRVPDADMEWQKLRRQIRAESKPARSRGWLGWLALPAAAAAAFVIAFSGSPADRPSEGRAGSKIARAEVEASVENAAPVVYVDDTSGWVFVWTANEPKRI